VYIIRRINELLRIKRNNPLQIKERQCVYEYKRNAEANSRNRCCRGKAKSIKYSPCVFVALIIRHEKSLLLMIFSSVVCLVVPYFSTLSRKRHDFRENFIEHKKCVLLFSTRFV